MAAAHRTAEEARALQHLENLLVRFYEANISNDERSSLEIQLQHLRSTTFNWLYCLDNLSAFNNQYLWFFASSTVEAILSRWMMLTEHETTRLRNGLINVLTGFSPTTPAMQRDKVAQILSLVASFQFPNDYPEYIDHILLLLKDRFPIGLALAAALGDSMTQERYVLSYEQHQQFRAAVMQHIPRLLRGIEPYFAYYLSSVAAATETQDESSAEYLEQHMIELLNMLQQYFSWIDLQLIEPSLIEALFRLALVEKLGMVDPDGMGGGLDVAMMAVSVLMELCYRKLPLALSTTRQIMMGVLMLLGQPNLDQIDELYQEKLSGLARLSAEREVAANREFDWESFFERLYQFTISPCGHQAFYDRISTWQHLFELHEHYLNDQGLPGLKHLLGEVYPMKLAMFTIERMLYQNDHQGFLHYVSAEMSDNEVFSEMQWHYRMCLELVEAAADIVPAQMHETVLAQLVTNDASPYRRVMNVLKSIATVANDTELNALRDKVGEVQLQLYLRDFLAAGEIISRLCQSLYGQVPLCTNVVRWLVQEQLELICLIAQCAEPCYQFFLRLPNDLAKDMVRAVAQLLSTFRVLLLLIDPTALSMDRDAPVITEQQLVQLCAQLVKYLRPLPPNVLVETAPLANNAANILLHLADTELVNVRSLYELMHHECASSQLNHLSSDTALMVRRTIIACLLSPWQDKQASPEAAHGPTRAEAAAVMIFSDDGKAALRREQLHRYVRFLAHELLTAKLFEWITVPMPERCLAIDQMGVELQQLTEMLGFFSGVSASAKNLLAHALRDVIERVLSIYEMTHGAGLMETVITQPGQRPETSTLAAMQLLEFCHAVIELLPVQFGDHFLQQVIRLFLERARVEASDNQPQHSLTALLDIFVLIVQQPGNRTLIPDIVLLSVKDVLPLVLSKKLGSVSVIFQSRLESALFELLHALLLHRWRYFVPSSLFANQQQPQQQQQNNQQVPVSEHQYVAILHGYGTVITPWHDTYLVRFVLDSLQQLNNRCKLFSEPIFVRHFLPSFMHAMLKLLATEQGNLYNELLVELLYELARSEPGKLHELSATVCKTLQPELRNQLAQCTDQPTFSQLMKQFVCMLRIAERSLVPNPRAEELSTGDGSGDGAGPSGI